MFNLCSRRELSLIQNTLIPLEPILWWGLLILLMRLGMWQRTSEPCMSFRSFCCGGRGTMAALGNSRSRPGWMRSRGVSLVAGLGIWAGVGLPETASGALTWDYSTSDSNFTISGQFETVEGPSHLDGSGIATFNISQFLSFNIEGEGVGNEGPVIFGGPGETSAPPRLASPGLNQFQWNRDGENGGAVHLGAGAPTAVFSESGQWVEGEQTYNNVFKLAFPDVAEEPAFGSELQRVLNDLYRITPPASPIHVRLDGSSWQTSISPVPEPSEWFVALGVGASVFVAIRRRRVERESCPGEGVF